MNIRGLLRQTIAGTLALLLAATVSADDKLQQVMDMEHRAQSSVRDEYRHPLQTLSFFGLRPDMTVVEIWPGGGWYTEILAPYLRDKGTFYAAHFDPETEVEYFRRSLENYEQKLAANPELYDQVKMTVFDPPAQTDIAPAGSVDMVLTFRNAHNWYMRGGGEEKLQVAFDAFYKALKPGGVLGVVDHRLPEGRPDTQQDSSGYIKQSVVVAAAEKAGFTLADSSDINANPKDTADYQGGVWTLPPSLREGDTNRDKYLAIGESDRMTLKFVKKPE